MADSYPDRGDRGRSDRIAVALAASRPSAALDIRLHLRHIHHGLGRNLGFCRQSGRARWLAGQLTGYPAAEVLAGAAVILGHNHSVFLKFRGGAGVGTSLGALGAIHLPAAIALAVLLLSLIAITRYASVGSLVVTTLMPIILLVLAVSGVLSLTYVLYGLLAWVIIVLSHRPNIERLIKGTERRLGEKPH